MWASQIDVTMHVTFFGADPGRFDSCLWLLGGSAEAWGGLSLCVGAMLTQAGISLSAEVDVNFYEHSNPFA